MGINESKIKVTIERMVGENFELEVEEFDSVASLKQKIYEVLSIDPNQQRLMYEGQLMLEEKALAFYNIHEGSIIRLSIWSSESAAFREI